MERILIRNGNLVEVEPVNALARLRPSRQHGWHDRQEPHLRENGPHGFILGAWPSL